ncbi:MAG: YkgJ family cysteine cluster protein [Promethearchaeota archaeon]
MIIEESKISKNFQNGIYFSCHKCGACCRGLNEGEVYIYLDDILRLIKFLKKKEKHYTLKSFARKYLKITSQGMFWKDSTFSKKGRTYNLDTLGLKFTGEDDHCYFLSENNICTVHEARPFQCRAFPIGWNMLMNNYTNLREYSKKCPALKNTLKNKGKYYSREEIVKWTRKELEIEYNYFLEMKKNGFDIFKVYKFLPRDIEC